MKVAHRNTEGFEEAKVDQTDAQKYGITVASSIYFKGSPPKPGHVFFVATFVKVNRVLGASQGTGFEEAYQVSKENIQKYGRELCIESVITQVVDRHFKKSDVETPKSEIN